MSFMSRAYVAFTNKKIRHSFARKYSAGHRTNVVFPSMPCTRAIILFVTLDFFVYFSRNHLLTHNAFVFIPRNISLMNAY